MSTEDLPHPHHGEGVELAVFEELSVNFRFTLRRGNRRDGFLVGFDGHAAVLDAFEVVVGEIRADGGEHGLDAPASVLAWVVVAISGDGKEIHDPVVDV